MNPASPASAVTVTQNGKDVDGYYKFSGYIAQDPLRSTTIFRRFDRLTARNLLYMESELAELENRLEELDDLPVHEDMEIYLQDWNLLRLQASYQDSQIPRELVIQELLREKRDLILEIRGKVKEYQEAVKLACEMFSLKIPYEGDVITNQMVLTNRPDREKLEGEIILEGVMADHLDDKDDLCSLAPRLERDWLTRTLERKLHKYFTQDDKGLAVDMNKYDWMRRIVTLISIVGVVGFIVAGVVGLYFVPTDHGRLALLSGLTLGFAIAVAVLTTAHRHETYAATAAYAAVLVVYIGSTIQRKSTDDGSVNSSSTKRDLGDYFSYLTTAEPGDPNESSDVFAAMAMLGLVFVCAFTLVNLRHRLRKSGWFFVSLNSSSGGS